MAGIYSQGGSAGHRYAGWLSEVEAKNFTFGGNVFNGSPSAIYVGSNLVWAPWLLKDAAIRAIVGAFGVDGWAVIKATNAYLTQLAASGQAGKDKATALAGFINEDPMMVCSLGLQPQGVTMPKREIYGDRTAYLVTNIKSSSALRYEVELTPAQTSGSETVFSGGVGWGNKYIQFGGIPGGTTLWRAYGNTTGSSSVNWQPGDWATAIVDEGKFYKDSTLLATLSYTDFETDNKMALWCAYRSGTASEKSAGGFRSFKAISKADGSVVGHLIPCKHNGENGMYDIEGMTWHGNSASSGTLTIPDISYTPSTP